MAWGAPREWCVVLAHIPEWEREVCVDGWTGMDTQFPGVTPPACPRLRYLRRSHGCGSFGGLLCGRALHGLFSSSLLSPWQAETLSSSSSLSLLSPPPPVLRASVPLRLSPTISLIQGRTVTCQGVRMAWDARRSHHPSSLPTVFVPFAGCQDRGRVSLISRVVTRRRRRWERRQTLPGPCVVASWGV